MTYKRLILLLEVAAYLGIPATAIAQSRNEYCAFAIEVKTPDGKPIPRAEVTATDQAGRIFGKALTNSNGIARICDAPEGLADFHVGGSRCGAITVRYLQAYWLQTRHVHVTYENCSGEEWGVWTGCMVIIRVRDSTGTPVSDAVLDSPDRGPKAREQTWTSDDFGRIFQFVPFGAALRGRVLKEGYEPKEIAEPCKRGEAMYLYPTVILGQR